MQILAEEIVETPQNVVPMNPNQTRATSPIPSIPTPPARPQPSTSLLPVFAVLVRVLSARLQSLLLVLLACGVSIATIVSPTVPRLVGAGGIWVFALVGIALLEWFQPRKP